MKDIFGIVIVTYNPHLDVLSKKIRKYSRVSKFVVIVNNGSEIRLEIKNCFILNLKKNMGIAYAQNKGVNFLNSKGVDYVFFLDQDSTVDEAFFYTMLSEWGKLYRNDQNIGLLSPAVFDRNLKKRLTVNTLTLDNIKRIKTESGEDDVLKNTLPISSGILTRVKIFNEIGGNDSWMFIDWVDFDFDIKVISNGFNTYTTTNISISHSIGKSKLHKVLKKGINVSNHAPFREFFFFRNGIYFYRKRGKEFPQLRSFIRHALLTRLVFVLYENNKLNRIKEIIRGFREGIRAKINEI